MGKVYTEYDTDHKWNNFMFVNKVPKQLSSSYCLLSTPWIVLTQWLLCKWLPHGDSVGTWGLYDNYIKLLHTSTSVREVQVIQVHCLGEHSQQTCRMRWNSNLDITMSMMVAASSTNPLGLTADACAQLHPLLAIASHLQQYVTQCSWSFVGTLCRT